MKKLLLIIFCLSLIGCAFFQSQKANWEACLHNEICKAQAKHWQEVTEISSLPVAAALPVPGAAVAPKILGYLAFAISMLIGGHAITKRQTVPPVV